MEAYIASAEELKEQECVDPMPIAPNEARYNRNSDVNDQNEKENAPTPAPIFVKKINYKQKFVQEKFNATAFQLIPIGNSSKMERKDKKRHSYETREITI